MIFLNTIHLRKVTVIYLGTILDEHQKISLNLKTGKWKVLFKVNKFSKNECLPQSSVPGKRDWT